MDLNTTGLPKEFDKIHLKDAIFTWPDMHSFSEFDVCLSCMKSLTSYESNISNMSPDF